MTVEAALQDVVEEVVLGLRDVGRALDGRDGVGAINGVVDARAAVRAAGIRRRGAAGGGAVGRGVEVAVGGPDDVVRVTHAGRVELERGVGREWVVRVGDTLRPDVEGTL